MYPLEPLLRDLAEHVVVEVLEGDDAVLVAVEAHDFRDAPVQLLREALLRDQGVVDLDELGLEDLPDGVPRDQPPLQFANVEFLELR